MQSGAGNASDPMIPGGYIAMQTLAQVAKSTNGSRRHRFYDDHGNRLPSTHKRVPARIDAQRGLPHCPQNLSRVATRQPSGRCSKLVVSHACAGVKRVVPATRTAWIDGLNGINKALHPFVRGKGEVALDIFYYWQKIEQDMRDGRVGYFGSNHAKLAELADRLPKRIWVFKTPKGMKGSIQLMGSLLVCEAPCVAVSTSCPHVIYYDPFSPESVIFTDSGTPERIHEVSGQFQYRFHSAFSANFHGDAGLLAMESNVVRGVEAMVADWERCQLLERVKDPKTVQPINPFDTAKR
jgi:hypothetical protein